MPLSIFDTRLHGYKTLNMFSNLCLRIFNNTWSVIQYHSHSNSPCWSISGSNWHLFQWQRSLLSIQTFSSPLKSPFPCYGAAWLLHVSIYIYNICSLSLYHTLPNFVISCFRLSQWLQISSFQAFPHICISLVCLLCSFFTFPFLGQIVHSWTPPSPSSCPPSPSMPPFLSPLYAPLPSFSLPPPTCPRVSGLAPVTLPLHYITATYNTLISLRTPRGFPPAPLLLVGTKICSPPIGRHSTWIFPRTLRWSFSTT